MRRRYFSFKKIQGQKILTLYIKILLSYYLNVKKRLLYIAVFLSFSIFSQSFQDSASGANLQYFNSLPEEIRNEIISESDQKPESISDIRNSLIKFNDASKSQRFGHKYFEYVSTTNTPVLDIPFQTDYEISLNDEVELFLTGSKNLITSLKVDLSGNIFIPEIGSISVNGLKISDANKKVQELINNSYVGTKSHLSVKRASVKKISVIGAVNNPGTYLMNPFVSISEALKYVGGLSYNASLRKIEIVNSEGNSSTYDLYRFLIFGDREVDANLKNGDTIVVHATTDFLMLEGEVLRPMEYEYLPTDSVADLVQIGLGLGQMADKTKISINQFEGNNLVTKSVALDDLLGDAVTDSIFIGNVSNVTSKGLLIRGSSTSQGYVSYSRGDFLSNYIKNIQFSDQIYPFYAVLKQNINSGLGITYKSFSISDPETYSSIKLQDNPEIQFFSREDIVKLSENLLSDLSKTEYEIYKNIEELDLKIQQIQYQINDNLNLQSLGPIDMVVEDDGIEETDNLIYLNALIEKYQLEKEKLLGSISEITSGINAKSELIKEKDLKLVFISTTPYKLPITGRITPELIFQYFAENINLESENVAIGFSDDRGFMIGGFNSTLDSNNISIMSFPENQVDTISVSITGQVNNPGEYTVNSQTTLDDLYKLAGGLRDSASTFGIILTRESIKEKERIAVEGARRYLINSIVGNMANNASGGIADLAGILALTETTIDYSGRVTGDLTPGGVEASKIYLQDGDEVYIPSTLSTISVNGEVLNPLTTSISANVTWEEYIDMAGGYNEYADRSGAYVIKANGRAVPLNQNYFTKGIFPEPGDTIVIPRNIDKLSLVPLVSISTKIISDVAFAAASLNSLRN